MQKFLLWVMTGLVFFVVGVVAANHCPVVAKLSGGPSAVKKAACECCPCPE